MAEAHNAGALFEAAQVDQDAVVAREEITRYYNDRLAEARAAFAKAQAELAAREADQAAWWKRGEISPDMVAGTDMAASMIASHSISRYQEAALELLRAIGERGERAEVQRLGEREKALRRWLTANGHNLGALAEPPPAGPRGRRTTCG